MVYENLHEVKVVEFASQVPRALSELLPVFSSNGFTVHEDVVSCDRKEQVPPWQHSAIVEVEVLFKGSEVFGFEDGSWDTINLRYLFASLPFDYSQAFADIVDRIGASLGITPTFRGVEVNSGALQAEFSKIRQELISETGEDAGSEGLAIMIQMTYPRR